MAIWTVQALRPGLLQDSRLLDLVYARATDALALARERVRHALPPLR